MDNVIDVCICTHNPRLDVLSVVVQSIARQTAGAAAFRVLVVDNASLPRLREGILDPIRSAGIDVRMVFEPTPGLQRARLRAIEETSGEWVLFVDDDNELMPNFLACGLEFISQHENVGCFGGKLKLPAYLAPNAWVRPFLPYLGIKDAGDEVIIKKMDKWGPWEPAGAGAWVRRNVLSEYQQRSRETDRFFRLGRTGTSNLASCDDSILMRGAFRVDMACAYVPQLELLHHLCPKRFRFRYLLRLMHAYGSSHVTLETILSGRQLVPKRYADARAFLKLLLWVFGTHSRESFPFAVGQIAYHLGAWREHRQEVERG